MLTAGLDVQRKRPLRYRYTIGLLARSFREVNAVSNICTDYAAKKLDSRLICLYIVYFNNMFIS